MKRSYLKESSRKQYLLWAAGLAVLLVMLLLPKVVRSAEPAKDKNSNRTESLAYFDQARKVFQSPRCLNCHPAGDQPTQGSDMHIHIMNVRRGTDDHGAVGMKCASCHNDSNNSASKVPGAPKWGLAPISMAWQGLNSRELCLALKDKKKTHGMGLEEMIKHNGEDALVAWAWNPGEGREPAPGTQKEFGQNVAGWVRSGAHCPN